MRLRRLLTLVLLAVAIASGWSIWMRAHPGDDGVLLARPDYVLRDFEVVSLDRQGKEAFTLLGPELQRNPADRTLALATPRFLVPDREGRYWDVRARRGWVPADGSRIELHDEVLATSPPQAPPPTRIETDRLALDLNRNLASTSADVTITRPGLTMQGKGLEADLDRQQVSLLSQVRTRYVPQH
ncbi:LPS export ABC transporter periplasmic protein LptC [Thermomonas sp. S9]|uniref:LPS export ABC transporter periplasmic protein LptC n=1 Tax=Thermomonas sp. S9 TaxID=2885203 RepID=UPI001AC46819|nr:LPS export ABC transporter periplasmic protein LptC [Thermomonas sp. S9]MBN8716540.1 LPS export ABC transporter periplasmic protein LptC [Xanthomonadales bacterium]MBN8768001.1 LPS export ABC transporter periplasmic protein LptC [Stenotrophomonas sp.]MCR6497034.1 LPS export ABC transporter periplasmic protein LptC [Thermomonas sp. S9]